MWKPTDKKPDFNEDQHDYNIDRRMMERDNIFNIDTQMDLRNDNMKNIAGYRGEGAGEITGEAFDIASTDQGMPLRAIYDGNTKENVPLLDSSLKYNPHLDFDLYDSKPQINVEYFDPNITDVHPSFSNINDKNNIMHTDNNYELQLSNTINDFSIFLLNKIIQSFKNKSNVISPFNILSGINMLYRGSKGVTEQEIRSILKFPDKDTTFLSFQKLYENMKESGSIIISNSIFVADKFPLNKAFSQFISSIGAINNINTSQPAIVAKKINRYIEESTRGIFKKIIEPDMISEATRMILISCIYFYSKWKKPFDINKTKISPFYSMKGVREEYLMYSNKTDNMYHEDEYFQYLEKEFIDNKTVMGFVLPKDRADMNINYNRLSNAIRSMKMTEINDLVIPRLEQTSKYEVGKVFSNMGITSLFQNADLSDITSSTEPLYINNVIQKAYISVNETGVKASAVFVMDCINSIDLSEKINFIANHPFIYYIRYKPTKTIIFSGVFT